MAIHALLPHDGKQYETDFRKLWLLPQCLWRTDHKNQNQDKEGEWDFHVKNSEGDKTGRPRLPPLHRSLSNLPRLKSETERLEGQGD